MEKLQKQNITNLYSKIATLNKLLRVASLGE